MAFKTFIWQGNELVQKHMGPLVKASGGSSTKALEAIRTAFTKQARDLPVSSGCTNGLVREGWIMVEGLQVWVKGSLIEGGALLGTASMAPR
jgi:hypothetical protein